MSRRTASLAGVAAFLLSAGLRIANVPQIPLVDELYHLKRISFSAEHFPRVLELDRDRGIGGAFCPWPPLYDLAAGGMTRLLGARTPAAVLATVIWFPPMVFAIGVALTVYTIARSGRWIAALLAGVALSSSPFLVTSSWTGKIDHHYLEPLLVLGILGATLLLLRDRAPRRADWLLATAMTTAVFVQVALLVACGLSFVTLFLARRRAALAFALPAAVIVVYRLTRMPGYPDSSWFLGWPHATLFAAAAAALLLGRALGLAAGISIALSSPSVLEGLYFFGGDRWLSTIEEFQPLTRAGSATLLSYAVGLSSALLLVAVRRDRFRLSIAGFAFTYLILTLSSQRFVVIAIPLLALSGTIVADDLRGKRMALIVAVLLLVVLPPLQLALWLHYDPPRPIREEQLPYVRAAEVLRARRSGERLLAPWSYGHLFDVAGRTPVVIDNFGTMPDPIVFERAYDALRVTDEAVLARYCRENGVRWVAINSPVAGLRSAAVLTGVPAELYIRNGEPTPLARRTWWWRAFTTAQPSSSHFRLIYAEKQIRIWEFTAGGAGEGRADGKIPCPSSGASRHLLPREKALARGRHFQRADGRIPQRPLPPGEGSAEGAGEGRADGRIPCPSSGARLLICGEE